MHASRPDWQLPRGVSRSLWTYLHDADVARAYDASLSASALTRVDQLFAERHCPRPGRLIDLGCGTGRLLLPFAQRGYWVVGVDLSAEMLQVAGEKARTTNLLIQRVQANLVELDAIAGESFDYATCLFSTLGMVRGQAERRRVLEHARRLLRPGGVFILHVHNRWFNVWNDGGRAWLLRDLLGFGRADRGDMVMPPHQQGRAGLTLHLFTRGEVVRLLRAAGFEIVEICPLSLRPDGRLPWPSLFGWLRSYGYLVAARRR